MRDKFIQSGWYHGAYETFEFTEPPKCICAYKLDESFQNIYSDGDCGLEPRPLMTQIYSKLYLRCYFNTSWSTEICLPWNEIQYGKQLCNDLTMEMIN